MFTALSQSVNLRGSVPTATATFIILRRRKHTSSSSIYVFTLGWGDSFRRFVMHGSLQETATIPFAEHSFQRNRFIKGLNNSSWPGGAAFPALRARSCAEAISPPREFFRLHFSPFGRRRRATVRVAARR